MAEINNQNGYIPDDHMYMYDLGWLVKAVLNCESELTKAIELRTIHYADPIEWSITTQYQANTVVVDANTGTAYISSQPVPSGVLLSDKKYWSVIFNYADAINKLMSNIASNERDNLIASKSYEVGDLVWYQSSLYRVIKAMSAADTFVVDTNIVAVTIADQLKSYIGLNRTATISGTDTLTAGVYVIEVTGDNTLKAANYFIAVDGDYTINAGNASVTAADIVEHSTGDSLRQTDGAHTEKAASYSNEVTGAHTEKAASYSNEVTGAHTEKAASYSNEVTGAHTVKANATSFEMPYNDIDIKSVLTNIVNVRNYGAKGDGVTDDTQAFIDALAAGAALIPSGTYLISGNIELTNSLIGIGDAHIKYTGSEYAFKLGSAAQISNIKITGLTFDNSGTALKLYQTLKVMIESCTFNSDIGIETNMAFGTYVTDCNFYNPKECAIFVNNGGATSDSNGLFLNNVLVDGGNNATAAVLVYSGEGLYFENCEFIRQKTAVSIPLEHGARNIFMNNCICDLMSTYGMLIDGDVFNVMIDNSWFGTSELAGLFVSSFAKNINISNSIFVNNNIGAYIKGDGVSFSNCSFNSNSKSGNATQDNIIFDGCTNSSIVGCNFTGAAYGYAYNVNTNINVSAGCHEIVVAMNRCTGANTNISIATTTNVVNVNNIEYTT